MTKEEIEKLKKILAGLGISATIITGIIYYFEKQPNYITWEEYSAIIQLYNEKLTNIKADCENDKRCLIIDGEKRVLFNSINKKNVIKQLDKWIKDDMANPNTYKINNK